MPRMNWRHRKMPNDETAGGNPESGVGVQQPEVEHHQVERDQQRNERDHGCGKDEIKQELAAWEIEPCEDVASQRGGQQGGEDDQRADEQAVEIGPGQPGCAPDEIEPTGGPLPREQLDRLGDDIGRWS